MNDFGKPHSDPPDWNNPESWPLGKTHSDPTEWNAVRGSVPPAGERPPSVVIDTMNNWLAGEPVWPYAKILEVWGEDFEMYRRAIFRNDMDDYKTYAHKMMERHRLRDEFIARFGFSIPCGELMDELARSKIVIEIGAGTGYMTRLMRNRHANVVGTDPQLGHAYAFTVGAHDPGQIRLPGKTAIRRFDAADTVFCSWPSYSETWFRQALKAMRVGQRMVVVREDACADNSAWEYFDACFEPVSTIDIPAFQGLNDYVDVRVKKRQRISRRVYSDGESF